MTSQNMSSESERKKRLDVTQVKLHSQRPSDIFGAMLDVKKWLQENIEDQEIYEVLLDAVRDNPSLRPEVRSLLDEMIQKGSKSAAGALRVLPADIKDLMADADDAYYTADYDESIELYQKVLQRDPTNVRAREQMTKAELNRIAGLPNTELPRSAIQYFRRARSHIAARDFGAAMNLLNAALEAAKSRGMEFPEAENLLNSMQDLWTADEYKAKANAALKKEHWSNAWDMYNKALLLNPQDQVIKELIEGLDGLMRADALLDSLSDQPNEEKEKREKLEKIDTFLKAAEEIKLLVGTSLLKNSRARYNQYQGKGIKAVALSQRALISMVVLLLTVLGIVSFILYIQWNSASPPAPTTTTTPTNTVMAITTSPTFTETPTPSVTTVPPTITFTPTVIPTTAIPVLGTGIIAPNSLVTARDAPNGSPVIRLQPKEPLTVTIHELKDDHGDRWYLCTFDYLDKKYERVWILASNVTLSP